MQVELLVRGYPSRMRFAEWQTARSLPESELPKLTQEQQARARRLHITDREFAVGLKAGQLMSERAAEHMERVARLVAEGLKNGGSSARLKTVLWDFYGGKFEFAIEDETGTHPYSLPMETVDDVLLDKDGAEQRMKEQVDFIVSKWRPDGARRPQGCRIPYGRRLRANWFSIWNERA